MKKIVSLIIILLIAFSLTSYGDTPKAEKKSIEEVERAIEELSKELEELIETLEESLEKIDYIEQEKRQGN